MGDDMIMDERLVEINKELQREIHLLKGLLKNSRDIIYRMSLPGGEYEYVSPAAIELLGYSPEELYQSPLHIRNIIHPDWIEYLDTQWKRLLAGDMPPFYEYQIIHKSGATRWIFQKNVLIRDENGTPVAIEGIVSDITEHKEIQAKNARLAERNRQAQKAEAIGRLAGGVAHGLNNLLMPMIGYAEMLADDLIPDDERRWCAEQIVHSGIRAKHLVRQLLAYGRKQTLVKKMLDMNVVLKRMEKSLRRAIREEIDIQILPSSGPKTIRADAKQIQQVIMTLAINAQRAMSEGGTITIETERVNVDKNSLLHQVRDESGDHVMLTVTDTGCGMDEKTRDQIFDPFFSTSGVLGTDLGLATVYGVVKQHEGNIFVDSKPGKGTTVKILLPFFEGKAVDI